VLVERLLNYFTSPLPDGITGQTIYVSGGEIMAWTLILTIKLH